MQEILEQIPHWLQSISFFLLSMFKIYSGVIFIYSYGEILLIIFSGIIFLK